MEDDRLERQGGAGDQDRGKRHVGKHTDLEAGPDAEEEEHQKEIPQRPQVVGDVGGDGAGGQGHAGDKGPDLVGETQPSPQLGHAHAPADGDQEHVFPDGIETPDQRDQNEARAQAGAPDNSRQHQQHPGYVGPWPVAGGCSAQQQQHGDGDQILQQQDADDDLPRPPVVQHGGGQQLEPDDGAGEAHGAPEHQGLQRREADDQPDPHAGGNQDEWAAQGHQGGAAYALRQFLGIEVQTEQEQQEHDPDMGDLRGDRGVRHQTEPGGAEQDAQRDVGQQQRLARGQCQGGKHRGAGEHEEDGIDDGVLDHAAGYSGRLGCVWMRPRGGDERLVRPGGSVVASGQRCPPGLEYTE